MQTMLMVILSVLPLGEARLSGLADAGVTMATPPMALYVNPALLGASQEKKLLYNPVGFRFNEPDRRGEEVLPRLFSSYTGIGFTGYTQPLGVVNAGVAGFQEVPVSGAGGNDLLVGAAYKWRLVQAGACLGIRYLRNVPENEPRFRPALGAGFAVPGIKFADVPGQISIAGAFRSIEWPNLQLGLDYNISLFRFLVNFNMREPFVRDARRSTVHLAGLFNFDKVLGIPVEFGGGWASDNRYGILAAANLGFTTINLSYSKVPDIYSWAFGRVGFSFLFNIASSKEVAERLATIERERETKSQITSSTYTSQGIDLYREGDYQGAIQAFDLALIWDPSNKDALNWLERVRDEKQDAELRALIAAANAAMRSEDYLEAMNKAQSALEVDSTSVEARQLAQEAERKFTDAVFATSASQGRNAGEINALYQQGLEQYAAGEYKAAEETWNKIEKLQPRSTRVQTYQKKTAEKIADQVAQGLKRLETLEKQERWADALQLASRLKRMVPANREVAAKIELYQSKIKTAAASYQSQALDFYNRGYYVKAQNTFYQLLALDPDNPTAKQYLAKIKTKLAQKDADALYLEGVQAYTHHQYQQAVDYWNQVLVIDPDYPNAAKNVQRAKEKIAQLK